MRKSVREKRIDWMVKHYDDLTNGAKVNVFKIFPLSERTGTFSDDVTQLSDKDIKSLYDLFHRTLSINEPYQRIVDTLIDL